MQEEAFDVEYIPALHTEYEEEPSAHAAPAGHEMQNEEPTTVEYLPAPHLVQSARASWAAAAEAASTLFVPTGRSVQVRYAS